MKHDVFRSNHGEAGRSETHHFSVGRFHLNISREVGLYGFPQTVAWSVRWWVA